jgi:hypothetical protein
MVGPALCTWLAVTWSPFGFLVIAAVAVLSAAAMPPVARAAARVAGEAKPRSVAAGAVDTIGRS